MAAAAAALRHAGTPSLLALAQCSAIDTAIAQRVNRERLRGMPGVHSAMGEIDVSSERFGCAVPLAVAGDETALAALADELALQIRARTAGIFWLEVAPQRQAGTRGADGVTRAPAPTHALIAYRV